MDIKKLFVWVPASITDLALVKSASVANPKKVYFCASSNEIVVNGVTYGASANDIARITDLESSISDIEDIINGTGEGDEHVDGLTEKLSALSTLVGAADAAAGTDTAFARIKALETLIGDEAADADDVINKLNEVYAWFNEVAETATGKTLIESVAANTAAIGAASKAADGETPAEPATGLYVPIEDLQGRVSALESTISELDNVHTTVADSADDALISVSTDDDKVVTIEASATLNTAITALGTATDAAGTDTAFGRIAKLEAEDKVHTTVADSADDALISVSTDDETKVVTVEASAALNTAIADLGVAAKDADGETPAVTATGLFATVDEIKDIVEDPWETYPTE